MAWFTKSTIELQGEVVPQPKSAPPVVPQPQPVARTLDADELKDYVAVCDEIGVQSAAFLTEAKLRSFMEDNHIQVYPLDRVNKYLDKTFRDKGWQWRPLRTQDSGRMYMENHLIRNTGYGAIQGGGTNKEVYQKPVPLPVLLTVKAISKAVPEALFFVSCEREFLPSADPFLAVMAPGMEPIVIERWDEPSFRG